MAFEERKQRDAGLTLLTLKEGSETGTSHCPFQGALRDAWDGWRTGLGLALEEFAFGWDCPWSGPRSGAVANRRPPSSYGP